MEILDYVTMGGKNLIFDYINQLPDREKLEILDIRDEIEKHGRDALAKLNTRQLRGKLWEIKASQSRIMYILVNADAIAFLHICKKQKGKTELNEIRTAIKRAKAEKLM